MPKVHNIGPLFVQFTKFPYEWDGKFVTRGWTQEIDEPFRCAEPIIVRLPNYKAIVFGRWTGTKTEEEVIIGILGSRVLTDEDFQEGWTPPAWDPDQNPEEGLENINT
jgi:hypothetical protein